MNPLLLPKRALALWTAMLCLAIAGTFGTANPM